MEKQKLGFSIFKIEGMPTTQQIPLLKEVGFDSISTIWEETLAQNREVAEKYGLGYQYVHGTNRYTQHLWTRGEDADVLVREWVREIEVCADAGVPILVVHPFRGIDMLAEPCEAGIENFKHVAEAAVKHNVRVAVENCEGENYLAALLDAFADCPQIGFCWDTGHELCYNRGLDVMARHGHRLFCTHFNDNFGVRSADGRLTNKDDLHLLPYDGKQDWKNVMERVRRAGYRDTLTLELIKREGRYEELSIEEFYAEAYRRACRIVNE